MVYQVVGAGVGILNNKSCSGTTCSDLRKSYLTYITNASSLQVRGLRVSSQKIIHLRALPLTLIPAASYYPGA